jgi:hypothetical protein
MNRKAGFVAPLLVPAFFGIAALSCSGTAPSCNHFQEQALAEITKAAASVPQCVVDADCKPIDIPGDCLDCVYLAGNDDVRAAVAARTDAVESICASFHRSGCVVIPSGCPGIGPWVCEGGKCEAH